MFNNYKKADIYTLLTEIYENIALFQCILNTVNRWEI